MIDFLQIKPSKGGQTESFESLIRTLAKREKPQGGIEYQPNDGRGGDGGVEAIWLLDNGKKIGYQAKFFSSLKASQWRQMDKSVEQALKVHPELQKYIFVLPFDLTSSRNFKGKSEREKWEESVDKWKAKAREQNIIVEFEIWTKTDLCEKLYRPENEILIKYWFKEKILEKNWFQKQINQAISLLDDRFNPDDHINVYAETLFDCIVRGPQITKKLITAFEELEKIELKENEKECLKRILNLNDFSDIVNSRQKLLNYKYSFLPDFEKKWDVDTTLQVLNNHRDIVRNLSIQCDSIDKNKLQDKDKTDINNVSLKLRKLLSVCSSLERILNKPGLKAESLQCAVISGPAGVGKSHILGYVACQRSQLGLPTILELGQNFSEISFWKQLANHLGFENKHVDDVLGILNFAGEQIGQRTILLFDAINEGVGAQYWRDNLPNIIKEIKKYSYLAVVFSCRKEYLSYAIPKTISEEICNIEIQGFSTQEEMEAAAKQYLDKKGIARPNILWLSPEFRNPLFLKSTSEALLDKGLSEFPQGIMGISDTINFYLDALSYRIRKEISNLDAIPSSIKKAVFSIAQKMAEDGCDFVKFEDAVTIINNCFQGRTAPVGKTWLQILVEVSLFRREPLADLYDSFDYRNSFSECVRFTFQRFQDHFMALTLVKQINKKEIQKAVNENGPLNFLFYESQYGKGIKYKYAGLVSALSTVYPEKFDLEFAKTLPHWEKYWEKNSVLQEGFAESFKWRNINSFSDSSEELLNKLDDPIDKINLLLEVSLTMNHKFNANYLHYQLRKYLMPERDSFWTYSINWISREEFNQIDRIISWASSISNANVVHMELASIVLAWMFSSSHRALRDRATKALTSIFLANANIFCFILNKMDQCDDPYIVERIYAAAYGACCLDQDSNRLNIYSKNTYNKIFANKSPPVALLTRDYALGIIELANTKGVLNKDIDIKVCYPPFESDEPKFDLTKKEIESIAKSRGGSQIFNSVCGAFGDYGNYTVSSRVRNFLKGKLNNAAPISKNELKRRFIEEVIKSDKKRTEMLEAYEVEYRNGIKFNFMFDTERNEKEYASHKEKLTQTLNYLKSLLNEAEQKRFEVEYLNGKFSEEFEKIDIEQCRFWVAKRAYELGWNSELFHSDSYKLNYDRSENNFERIGKKYQHIALDELEARLSDHYWFLQNETESPGVYRYSHQDFRRDIEPTILPFQTQELGSDRISWNWVIEPIPFPNFVEKDMKQWPFEEDPTKSMLDKLIKRDTKGKEWLVLYEANLSEQDIKNEQYAKWQEIQFLYCVFLRKQQKAKFINTFKANQYLGNLFMHKEFTDGPFLREAYWRETWFSEKFYETKENFELVIPVAIYHWESHLDKSLPEGFVQYIPQKWFAEELGVKMSNNSQIWQDKFETVVIQTHMLSKQKGAIVIDKEILNTYAKKFSIEPVWIMFSERNIWMSNGYEDFFQRKSESIAWIEKNEWKSFGKNKDHYAHIK